TIAVNPFVSIIPSASAMVFDLSVSLYLVLSYRSTNFSPTRPESPSMAAVAAFAAASISASGPDSHSRPNAPYGWICTSDTCAAFSASLAAHDTEAGGAVPRQHI